ncbi:MAG: VWA domain-containing protein [Puniceicoccaceae bacterium]|nr:MAG: VWA domain-containing protein [Puniceicoccaceae bacterium]
MSAKTTEIAFILDRSGSMDPIRAETIAGYNSFLSDQQALPGRTTFSLVLFDDVIDVVNDALPITEVVPLDADGYKPRGCTALLDAIGSTIHRLDRRIEALKPSRRPGKVMVAILTDGLENASRRHTWDEISGLIRERTTEQQWEFLFLGANQDAIATAAKISIAASQSATFCNDAHGSSAAYASITRSMRARKLAFLGRATGDVMEDAARPLADILREEEARERGSPPPGRNRPRR